MRILHFFKTYYPENSGGIERVIWQIAEGTAPLGVVSDVLSLSRSPSADAVAIERHRAHKARLDLYVASTGLSLSVFGKFAELARQADVVHYHFPWPMMDVVHLATRLNKPSVVTYHSDIVRQRVLSRFYRPLMDRFLGQVDAIVATSPNYVASSAVLKRHLDTTQVIPIGIADVAAPAPERLFHWRERVGDRFFLFVGAMRYYKGLAFLLEAARQSGLPVVLAGSGEFQQDVAAAGLPNVTMLGDVEEADKEALLSLCTAFVFPSHLRSEAFGVALLEGARAGRPMISCEIGTGTSYINIDGETGLVVPPADAGRLADAMRWIWDNTDQAEAMGANARRRYENVFTASRMAQSYFDLYRRLLARR